jgi:hypothetical protein
MGNRIVHIDFNILGKTVPVELIEKSSGFICYQLITVINKEEKK